MGCAGADPARFRSERGGRDRAAGRGVPARRRGPRRGRHGGARARDRRPAAVGGLDRETPPRAGPGPCVRTELPPALPRQGRGGPRRARGGRPAHERAGGRRPGRLDPARPLQLRRVLRRAGLCRIRHRGAAGRLPRAGWCRHRGQGRPRPPLRAAGKGRGFALRREAPEPMVGAPLQGPAGAREGCHRGRVRDRSRPGRREGPAPGAEERRPGERGRHPGAAGEALGRAEVARRGGNRPGGVPGRGGPRPDPSLPRHHRRHRARPHRPAHDLFRCRERGRRPARPRPPGRRGRRPRRALRSPRPRRPGLAAARCAGGAQRRRRQRLRHGVRAARGGAAGQGHGRVGGPPDLRGRAVLRRGDRARGIVGVRRPSSVPAREDRRHDQPRHGRAAPRRPARRPRQRHRAAVERRSRPSLAAAGADRHAGGRRLRSFRSDQLLRRGRARAALLHRSPRRLSHARRQAGHAERGGGGARHRPHRRPRGGPHPGPGHAGLPAHRVRPAAVGGQPGLRRVPGDGAGLPRDGGRRRRRAPGRREGGKPRGAGRDPRRRSHRRSRRHEGREPLRHDLCPAGAQAGGRGGCRGGAGRGADHRARGPRRAGRGAGRAQRVTGAGGARARPRPRCARRSPAGVRQAGDRSFLCRPPRARLRDRGRPALRRVRGRAAPGRRPPAHLRRGERRALLQPRRRVASSSSRRRPPEAATSST